tara:strand:- start:8778 stop:8924 length:147 start_codon:yes stop_codon:yes gene_type:complete
MTLPVGNTPMNSQPSLMNFSDSWASITFWLFLDDKINTLDNNALNPFG